MWVVTCDVNKLSAKERPIAAEINAAIMVPGTVFIKNHPAIVLNTVKFIYVN